MSQGPPAYASIGCDGGQARQWRQVPTADHAGVRVDRLWRVVGVPGRRCATKRAATGMVTVDAPACPDVIMPPARPLPYARHARARHAGTPGTRTPGAQPAEPSGAATKMQKGWPAGSA